MIRQKCKTENATDTVLHFFALKGFVSFIRKEIEESNFRKKELVYVLSFGTRQWQQRQK